MQLEEAKKNLYDFAGIQIVESLDFFKMRTEDIKEIQRSLETVLQVLDNLKQENTKLKASHIITRKEATDKEKAELFDIIDSTVDTYLNNTKPYWGQIMDKDKMSIEEAEQIIDEMYQDRNKIIEDESKIDVSKLSEVKFTNLEFASVRALREIQSLRRALDNSIPKKVIEEYKNEFIEESKNQETFMTHSSQISASLISFCKELLKHSQVTIK